MVWCVFGRVSPPPYLSCHSTSPSRTLELHTVSRDHPLSLAAAVSSALVSKLFLFCISLDSPDVLARPGFRLFQLSMCTALLFMCVIRRTSPFRYHSEWFFRLSGLCLDLMTTAAISRCARFRSPPDCRPIDGRAPLLCLHVARAVVLILRANPSLRVVALVQRTMVWCPTLIEMYPRQEGLSRGSFPPSCLLFGGLRRLVVVVD